MTTLTDVGINVSHTSLVELISANIVYEVSHVGEVESLISHVGQLAIQFYI